MQQMEELINLTDELQLQDQTYILLLEDIVCSNSYLQFNSILISSKQQLM